MMTAAQKQVPEKVATQQAETQQPATQKVASSKLATQKIACAPQIGDYHIVADMLMQRLLGYETLTCPPMTKRTVELGARHSPDMVCTPFKTTLGNLIEAAELGANVFVMPGAGCRLGFYDILQKQVLTDLGYDFEMFTLFDYIPTTKRLFQSFQAFQPTLTKDHFDAVFETVAQVTMDMDRLADTIRRNVAFEQNAGEFDRHYRNYLNQVKTASDAQTAKQLATSFESILGSVAINKPDRPVRIGIIGEIYVVAEPFANCYLEAWLIDHKVEIDRRASLSQMAVAVFSVDQQIENSGDYVRYNIGSTANDAIAQAYDMASNNIDGIIHVKPASCSPEITAMSVLQNISRDFDIPIMYLTFDTETSEAGLQTRLEAFLDMILMKGLK